jgi:hypothetical protein
MGGRSDGDNDIFVITLNKADGSYAPTVETIKFDFWMGLLEGLLDLALCLACSCYCCRREKQSKYFPKGNGTD